MSRSGHIAGDPSISEVRMLLKDKNAIVYGAGGIGRASELNFTCNAIVD